MSFETPIALCGPLREPQQMLAEQEYDSHSSIHDDDMAEKLGFRAGPIEGPTHFSQFVPLLAQIWGNDWFERGCFSAHFRNMVVEGEAVRAFVEQPAPGATRVRAWAEKADGTPVLEASASLGSDPSPGSDQEETQEATLLEERMAKLRPPEKLVILSDQHAGMTGAKDERVCMEPDQHMGLLYPFSLNQKLACITEPSPWYAGAASPWGRAIIPLEMVSVLAEYSSHEAGFPVKQPVVGLFADQQIRMIDGPLFVGEAYLLRREIVALSESKRTESSWVRTRIYDADGEHLKAEMLLNHAHLKQSFPGYDQARGA